MPESSTRPASGAKSGFPIVAVIAIVTAAVLAVVVILARMNKDYTIAVDKDGKFNIAVASGVNLRDILLEALATDRASVNEVLKGQGYYHFADPDLANALEQLTPDTPEHAEAVAAMRRLLRDQRGPFVMPDTLAGLDAKLIEAFGLLDAKLQETKQTSDLVIGLWRQSLEYKGIFRTRLFDARVRRLPAGARTGGPAILIHACPGSDFNGSEISLYTADRVGSLSGVVGTSTHHRCSESSQKLAQLFSHQEALFGLDAESYQKLFSPGDPYATLPPELPAQFQFLPTGSTTLLQMGG